MLIAAVAVPNRLRCLRVVADGMTNRMQEPVSVQTIVKPGQARIDPCFVLDV